MKTQLPLKKILLGAGLFFLLVGINSCSDDDEPEPLIQQILIDDHQNLSGNTVVVRKIVVNQDSFLAAVKVEDENSADFIASPVLLTAGTHINTKLTFYDNAIKNAGSGQKITVKLYADNQDEGIKGVWDATDEPIMNLIQGIMKKTVTVYSEYDPFHFFDNNNNGLLDLQEVSLSYPDNFAGLWDSDNDGNLTMEEFYWTTFLNTDVDFDFSIGKEEWDEGYSSMYSNWAEDNFTLFDESHNNFLDNDEWNKIFEESQWFITYDSDHNGLISREEWNNGLLGDWDLDHDGNIDEDEFNNYWPHVQKWIEYYEW